MDIAAAFDAVGGEANAATGKEHTCYYARVLDDDLPMAVDVITDMVTSAPIDPQDVEGERGVILEELAMNDDDPSRRRPRGVRRGRARRASARPARSAGRRTASGRCRATPSPTTTASTTPPTAWW